MDTNIFCPFQIRDCTTELSEELLRLGIDCIALRICQGSGTVMIIVAGELSSPRRWCGREIGGTYGAQLTGELCYTRILKSRQKAAGTHHLDTSYYAVRFLQEAVDLLQVILPLQHRLRSPAVQANAEIGCDICHDGLIGLFCLLYH